MLPVGHVKEEGCVIMSFDKAQTRLAKKSMAELVALRKRVENDPKNKNPNKDSLFLFSKNARKRLANIDWAITYKLDEKRRAACPSTL